MGLFSGFGPEFRDITMKDQYMTCNIKMSKFGGRFRLAQIWLDRAIMEKMKPVIPYKTGMFLSKIEAANAGGWGMGKVVTAVPPQGRYLYPGISPRGKPFNWTNPLTQPMWGDYTIRTYRKEFEDGVRHIVLTGRYK